MKILICSHNKHKISEIKQILNQTLYEIYSLLDLDDYEDVIEDSDTFMGNAYIKAHHYGMKHKMIALGDDSGLEVYSLDMKPGVHSKRYAGSDHANKQKLLLALKDVKDRRAQFRTVLALYNPESQETHYFEGILKGEITYEERGTNGFGYDALFYVEEERKTLAEMDAHEKNKISHRGLALEKLKEFL